MLRVVPVVALGFASIAAFAGAYLDPARGGSFSRAESFDARWNLAAMSSGVKQDRVRPVATPAAQPNIAAIEMVGLDSPLIIYRDREGRLLFRNDPFSRTTTIAKGVVVPDFNIRRNTPKTPALVPTREGQSSEPEKLPVACESAFSPVAAPKLAHIVGRCLVSRDPVQRQFG